MQEPLGIRSIQALWRLVQVAVIVVFIQRLFIVLSLFQCAYTVENEMSIIKKGEQMTSALSRHSGSNLEPGFQIDAVDCFLVCILLARMLAARMMVPPARVFRPGISWRKSSARMMP